MFKHIRRAWQLLGSTPPEDSFTRKWQEMILKDHSRVEALEKDVQRIMYHGHFVETAEVGGWGHHYGLCADGTVWERHIFLITGTDTGWTQSQTAPEAIKMTPKQFVAKLDKELP